MIARGDFAFQVLARATGVRARAGLLATPHGTVPTPAFMPVGTRGSVKGIDPRTLASLGTHMLLANAYHLHLRPGGPLVRDMGGLHRFMNWQGPILTDSGGYQVFSLAQLAKVDEQGVSFRSHIDGAAVRLEPESVIDLQRDLGPDFAMAFDQCPAEPADRALVEAATERTHRWLARCVARHRERGGEESGQALLGIVQGGAFEDLRKRSVEAVTSHDLFGYALGGVSVGESREQMRQALDAAAPLLPEGRVRYLMGVGTPVDFLDAIERGIDLFDCVTPTRHGRTHQAFVRGGRLNLRNLRFARDEEPLEAGCDCPACAGYSRAYLRHLCMSEEMLGPVLLTQHNLRHFHRLMERARAAIAQDRWPELRRDVLGDEAAIS